MEKDVIEVFVDGLCEPVNPRGVATFGFVVYKDYAKIKVGSGMVDSSNSSNNAECSALIQVLKFLVDNGFTEERVVVKSDS